MHTIRHTQWQHLGACDTLPEGSGRLHLEGREEANCGKLNFSKLRVDVLGRLGGKLD